jgi:hypothetical protein
MNKKDIVLIFVTIFFIIPISVKASSLNISLNCPTSINKNSYFNCKVHEVSSDGPIVNFQAEVSYTYLFGIILILLFSSSLNFS